MLVFAYAFFHFLCVLWCLVLLLFFIYFVFVPSDASSDEANEVAFGPLAPNDTGSKLLLVITFVVLANDGD